jgi:hypothetical protein
VRVVAATLSWPFSARDTVIADTPANSAIARRLAADNSVALPEADLA